MFRRPRSSGRSEADGRSRGLDLGELRRLFALARPYRRQLILGMVAVAVAGSLSLALPLLARELFNRAFAADSPSPLSADLDGLILLLIAVFVVQAVFNFVRVYLLGLVGEGVVASLRKRLFEHLLKLPVPFFDSRKTGEITSRLTADVATIQAVVSQGLAQMTNQGIILVGAAVVLFVLNARLTLVMLAVVPTVIIAGALFGRRLRKVSTSFQDRVAEANADAEEAIAGMRVVKVFNAEGLERARYARSIDESFRLGKSRAQARALFIPSILLAMFSGIALVMWVGGRQVLAGSLAPGDLVAFLVLTLYVAGSVGSFTGLYSQLQEAIGASKRIFELLDVPAEPSSLHIAEPYAAEPSVAQPSAAQPSVAEPSLAEPSVAEPSVAVSSAAAATADSATGRGRIVYDQVSFRYPDRGEGLVLSDISTVAEPGEVVALVGPSGAGKSTMVALLPRFYEPVSGRITLDGIDLRDIDVKELRRLMAMVPQETHLFSGTIAENIRYGRPDAGDDEVREAAKAANALGFIETFPDGFETTVGERGLKISGGQRQRIAIARALLKNPLILILDEATSSLDSESEALVQQALERLMEGRTTFVIAHRLATVLRADRIVVLDDGRLVQQGSHSSLLAQGGLYRELYRRQFDVEQLRRA